GQAALDDGVVRDVRRVVEVDESIEVRAAEDEKGENDEAGADEEELPVAGCRLRGWLLAVNRQLETGNRFRFFSARFAHRFGGAPGRTRTGTPLSGQRILSPQRLPIPPLGRFVACS